MNLCYKHILIALTLLVGVVGCTDRPDNTLPTDQAISLSVGLPNSRAMLYQGELSFGARGNRIKVYDFVGNTKHIDTYAGPDVQSSSPLHQTGTTWPFTDELDGTDADIKQWVPGMHNFFGWLAKDAAMNMTPEIFFGSGFVFNESTRVLNIPTKEMSYATSQFDFLYSDIKATEPTNNHVPMRFNHLFTAVSFGVENSTSSFVRIDEFRVEGIPNTRSATIDFSGAATTVNYSTPTSATFTRSIDAGKAPYEISPSGVRSNIFNGSTTQEFMMLWPVDAENLYSTDKTETTDEGEVVYPESWKMYIKYTADGQTYEKRMNFPNQDWEAGKKYFFNIVFADKMVELRTEVKPWEYEQQDINYSSEAPSLSAGGALTWNNLISSVDNTNKMVAIVNAQAAQAKFTLQTPVGGSWIVSLVGDVNAFEVSPTTGVIDTQTATVYVKPLVSSPARDYKVQLKFTVRRSDGRMIAADDIVQANGIYTVVLPRNN